MIRQIANLGGAAAEGAEGWCGGNGGLVKCKHTSELCDEPFEKRQKEEREKWVQRHALQVADKAIRKKRQQVDHL